MTFFVTRFVTLFDVLCDGVTLLCKLRHNVKSDVTNVMKGVANVTNYLMAILTISIYLSAYFNIGNCIG